MEMSKRSTDQADQLVDAWIETYGGIPFPAGVALRLVVAKVLDLAFAEGMEHAENLALLKRAARG